MMQSLPNYFEHISKNHNSLIARIYGIFQVQMEGIVPITLLLMQNVTHKADPNSKVFKTYDLKGSWLNRIVKTGEN